MNIIWLTKLTDKDSFRNTQLMMSEALRKQGIKVIESNLVYNPKSTVKLTGNDAARMLKLQNELDDHDDVQSVYANFEIEEKEMMRIAAELE